MLMIVMTNKIEIKVLKLFNVTADLLVPRQVPEGERDDGVAEGDVPVDVGPLLARAQERLLDHVEQEEPHDAVPLLELPGDVLQLEEELVRGLGVRPPAAVHVLDQQVEGADVDAVHCRHVQPVVESVLRMIDISSHLSQLH